MTTTRGNWTDRRCYYVTVIDGIRYGLLAGPFKHQRQAAAAVEPVRALAYTLDPRSAFYGFGTAKTPNGHREGTLNARVGIDRMPHQPRQPVRRTPDMHGFFS